MLTSAPLAMRTAMRAAHILRASSITLPRRWACAPAAAAPIRCFAAASSAAAAPPASSSSTPPSHSVVPPVPTSALAAGEIGDFEPDDPTVFFHTLPELTPPVQRLMAGYSHPVPVHVVWGEQDKFGHVNNARYITWIEIARIHWLRQLATVQLPPEVGSASALSAAVTSFMCGHGSAGPILKSNFMEYKMPVQYPDLVVVGSRLGLVAEDRFALFHRLVSLKTGRLVGEAEGLIVCFDYDKQTKTKLPKLIRAAIDQRLKEQKISDQTNGTPVKPPRKSVNFESF